MNLTRIFAAFSVCGMMAACAGSKPAVEPTAATVPAAAAPAPAAAPATSEPPKATVAIPGAGFADQVDRYSYALGMELGKSIANVDAPVNMMLLMSAIQDEVDPNRKVLMTDSTAEKALQDLLLVIQQKKEADAKASAQKALDEQKAFLEKNAADSTVKATPKGVQYQYIKQGEGITPKASDKVQVHYVGSLLDGTEFDNSIKRGEPLEFPVNAVIEGWQDLLQVLKEGDKVKAWIPSALAYGEAGVPPMIPANAMLVFEVELLKVLAEVSPAEDGIAPAATEAAAPADSAAQPAAEGAAPAAAEPVAEAPKATEPAKADVQKPTSEMPAGKK